MAGLNLLYGSKTLSMVENNKNCDGSIILQNVSGCVEANWLYFYLVNYVSNVKIDYIVPSTPIENKKIKTNNSI